MNEMRSCFGSRARVLLALPVIGLACISANAAVTILGTQYKPDQSFPEFDCLWDDSNYPTTCPTSSQGSTVHVYVKNTGASPVTIDDATLAGYSLKTVIKMSTNSWNKNLQNSIYFYWDNPPQDILDAGEPVWYKADPPTIPVGGVAQVAVRLRYIPTTPTVTVGVVTSEGTWTTNITVAANAPQLASIGYSENLQKVYLHWRRSGGAAPIAVWMDGTDVTANTTTVGDPTVNFGASVVSLANPLPFFSYHVFQGVYADGKIAAASQRAWTNKFIYGTYQTFTFNANYDGADWIAEATDHGINNVQMQLGDVGSYLSGAGRADAQAHGYGYTIMDPTKLNSFDPDMWFLNDEPDIEELKKTSCGTGLKIPCGDGHSAGTLVIKEVAHGEDLKTHRPNVPTAVNLDGSLEPESFFSWGPAVDILQFDNYYQSRLRGSYWNFPAKIPLYKKATIVYAVARAGCAGAEPNPTSHLLYAVEFHDSGTGNVWPFPTPESKRIEAYYSLAGGSKGMGYWWFNAGPVSNGLDAKTPAALALWKEIGLLGNEIKTARNLIVKSTPVNMTLAPGANVWARALASGTDSIILLVVNDNYFNDIAGCHYTNVANATVTATLPSWMQSSPNAFEITAGGLRDVNTQLNGNQFQLNLGTLKLTRMIILTADLQLRTTIQQRYDQEVKPHVCNFAPELCVVSAPSIALPPQSQMVAQGATATFTVVAGGTSPLAYQWRFNGTNISGATTNTYTRTNVQTNVAGIYSVLVTNVAGSVTSSNALLTVTPLQSLHFDSVTLPAPNQVRLVFNGTAGGNVTIQRSSNLINWLPLTSLINTNGTVQFTDTSTTNVPQRFYRVTSP